MTQAIFLAPHFDDVALSCGGTVAATPGALVVTLCASVPPGDPSPFARELHEQAGFSDVGSYVVARRGEDHAAAARLGARVKWGASLDAVYRLAGHYGDPARLLGEPAPGDPFVAEAAEAIQELLDRFPDAVLYAPLAVGGHVDHRIVSAAAARASRVRYYEDFPYVTVPGALAPRTRDLEPIVVDITDHLAARLDAVACYATQLGALFGTELRMRAAIAAYASSLAPPGRSAERFWRPR